MTRQPTHSMRRLLALAMIIPMLATGFVAVDALTPHGEAYAQQSGNPNGNNNNDRGRDGRDGSTTTTYLGDDEPERVRRLPPCPPDEPIGAAAIDTLNCTPWTPPPRAASTDDCECRRKTVDNKRVWDCYVLLPSNKVHYCENRRVDG